MSFNFKEMMKKKTLIGLGLGQILSLLYTSNAFTSSELARKGIIAPTSQSFLSYMLEVSCSTKDKQLRRNGITIYSLL